MDDFREQLPGDNGQIQVRAACPADLDLLFDAIKGLAAYEREPDAVVGTPAMLSEALFGEQPVAEAVIAELDGTPAGSAIFFTTFSTWNCSPGMWLEDIYVFEQFRRRAAPGEAGVGETILRYLARLAVDRGYDRMEWTALDWNEPALSFYRKHGAKTQDEWITHRLDGDTLAAVAAAHNQVMTGER